MSGTEPVETRTNRPDKLRENQELRQFWSTFRPLLALILLVSVGVTWVAMRKGRAERRRRAAEAIHTLGGHVTYEYDYDKDGNYIYGTMRFPPDSWRPRWLDNWLGEDYLWEVRSATVWTDEGIVRLQRSSRGPHHMPASPNGHKATSPVDETLLQRHGRGACAS